MAKYIDADEAILEIEKHLRIGDEIYQLSDKDRYTNDGLIVAADVVYHQPAADVEPVRRWIPCSERMPEDTNPVNITWVNHNPQSYYEHIKDKPFTATVCYHNKHWYWFSCVCQDWLDEYGDCEMDKIADTIEVIAWMPLPEPYKEGEQNE